MGVSIERGQRGKINNARCFNNKNLFYKVRRFTKTSFRLQIIFVEPRAIFQKQDNDNNPGKFKIYF